MLKMEAVKKNYLYYSKDANLVFDDSVIVDVDVTLRVTKVKNRTDIQNNFKNKHIHCLIIDIDEFSMDDTKKILETINLYQKAVTLVITCKHIDSEVRQLLEDKHITSYFERPISTDDFLKLELELRNTKLVKFKNKINLDGKVEVIDDRPRYTNQRKMSDVIDLISDIIMIPLMALTMIVFFSVFIMSQNNKVINIMGFSVIEVLTSSMTASGFEAGDNAIIRYYKPQDLKKGDYIAFYYYIEDGKNFDVDNASKLPFTDEKINTLTSSRVEESQKIAAAKGSRIYFHEIVDIAIDKDGDLWFQTKGSSNNLPDKYWTRQDYVLGRYVEGTKAITWFLDFITTVEAIVFLLIIPNGLAFMLYMIPFWNYIDIFMLEKKVLKGEISPYDDICIEKEVVLGMSNKNKLLLMDKFKTSDFITRDNMLREISGMRWKEMARSNKTKLIQRYKKYFQYI